MSKQEKAVAIKPEVLPAVVFQMDEELQALLPRAEQSDIEIPRLTVIQPTSTQLEGNPGDLIDSNTKEKVVTKDQKLAFVPVWFFKDYAISEVDDKGRAAKWLRNEPKTAENAAYSLFDNKYGEEDGKKIGRFERLNLFVMREDQMGGDDLPRVYRIVLKPSSFKEAKKLLTEWDIQIRSRLIPFTYMWSLTTKMISNEKGKFAIFEFAKEMSNGRQRQVTEDQFAQVQFWVKTLASNKEKVMAEDASDDIETEVAPVVTETFEAGKLNY